MIETFEAYVAERYSPLEVEFLTATKKFLTDNLPRISEHVLAEWRKALAAACEIQRDEKIPCAYMSVSFLNTSVAAGKAVMQIDFYDTRWVYGEPFSRSRMDADFLLTGWENFTTKALDEKFFVRSKISSVEIKSLFWYTLDKMTFIFTCFAKYFAPALKNFAEFDALIKAEKFYVTCGTYLDWQNRLCAVLPEIDFLNPAANEDTTFREAHGKIYRNKKFADLNLRGCNFADCLFYRCEFANLNLADAEFLRCRFVSANFTDIKFAGTKFSECTFRDCAIKNSTDAPNAVNAEEYFASLKVIQCQVSNTVVEGCDFEL